MVGVVVFRGEIDNESISLLIRELDNRLKETDVIELYFSSVGGVCVWSNVLLEYLNSRTESVILIGCEDLYSCGFSVFIRYKGLKKLVPLTRAMLHLTDVALGVVSHGIAKLDQEMKTKKEVEFLHKQDIKEAKKIGLNKKNIERLKKGEDVYLFYDELMKLDILK